MVSPNRFLTLSSRPFSPSAVCSCEGPAGGEPVDGGATGMVNGSEGNAVGNVGACWGRGAAVAVGLLAELSSGQTMMTTTAATTISTVTRAAKTSTAGWRHHGVDAWTGAMLG